MSIVSVPRSPGVGEGSSRMVGPRSRLQKRDSFVMVQGSALLVPDVETSGKDSPQTPVSQTDKTLPGDLQLMCDLLRPEDYIKLAIQLESAIPDRSRYFLLVSSENENRCNETIIVGMDIVAEDSSRKCSIGLVLPIWRSTQVFLDGDGGFSVTNADRTCVFKPLNIQAMWTVLQGVHASSEDSLRRNLLSGCGSLEWSNDYRNRLDSDQRSVNEWNLMPDLLSVRAETASSPSSYADSMESEIRTHLRSVLMDMDFETVTSKQIRSSVEQRMGQDLKEFRGYLDNETLLILAQMDKPSEIFDYLYLGTEWNAANLQELEENGVGYILNVTREIDNFFPGRFTYMNIRVYDEENADLLPHWESSYRFISTARARGSRCLVHCKMGVSRSASTVMAFVMKDEGWSLQRSLDLVRERRAVVRPNAGFMAQLLTYQGIVAASGQRHNALWRKRSLSHPDTPSSLTTRPESPSDPSPMSLSPSASTTRPEPPSASTTRPEPPSALSPRPQSPSSSISEPKSTTASTSRPQSPSDLTARPQSPSDLSPRPQSPSPLTTRPESPSASTARPQSPSDPSPRPQSPSDHSPWPESPSATTTGPQSPSDHSPRPQSPSDHSPRPESPSATTTGPDSPSTLSPRPQSPSPLTTRPESPSDLTARPQSPSDHSPRPQSPSDHSPRPQSPSDHSPRPQSPSSLTTRPESPSDLTARPQSPSDPSPGPETPSATTTGPDSPSTLSPRPQSPSSLTTRPTSPSDLTARPQSPSDLSPRPRSPSGLSPRPQSPSDLSPRPQSPSSLTTRPESPSDLTARPQSPSDPSPGPETPPATTTGPDSPSDLSPRPQSPSSLTTRPQSPSDLSPGPQSPSVTSTGPESLPDASPGPRVPSALTTRPQSPSALTTRPESPSVLSPGPQSPSVLTGGPESPSASATRPEPPSPGPQSPLPRARPPPLRPFLRSSSFGQQRVALSTVMRQLEAMEVEGEREEGTSPRARGWKRMRAFSLQGGLGLEQRLLRSLAHSDAVDFNEEEENAFSRSPPPQSPPPPPWPV